MAAPTMTTHIVRSPSSPTMTPTSPTSIDHLVCTMTASIRRGPLERTMTATLQAFGMRRRWRGPVCLAAVAHVVPALATHPQHLPTRWSIRRPRGEGQVGQGTLAAACTHPPQWRAWSIRRALRLTGCQRVCNVPVASKPYCHFPALEHEALESEALSCVRRAIDA